MNYLLLVCNDGIEASEAEEALVGETIGQHTAQIADVEIYGHPLQGPATAKSVRVRRGETLASDGPFVETKEHIAGFELLDCSTRERAIAAAASHPLAWFNMIEVRPLADGDEWSDEVRERLEQGPPAGKERYMLLICGDGTATDARSEAMRRELPRWVNRMSASGALIAGGQLAGPDTAELVRVRGPHTLVSDGPFVEAEEFIAEFDVIDCGDLDEAVTVAAAHPASWFPTIEVRPFSPTMCGEPIESEPSMEVLLADVQSPTS
jgi:hypothetical protein